MEWRYAKQYLGIMCIYIYIYIIERERDRQIYMYFGGRMLSQLIVTTSSMISFMVELHP